MIGLNGTWICSLSIGISIAMAAFLAVAPGAPGAVERLALHREAPRRSCFAGAVWEAFGGVARGSREVL